MIICNNIQETINAQSQFGEITTIGFSQKASGGLHEGHDDLIQQAKKVSNKTFLAFIWSDNWRDERYPLGYETPSLDFDKDYMINWFTDKVDIISFMDKGSQELFFNSVDLNPLDIWVDDIFNQNNYTFFSNKSLDSYIKWAMLISRIYEIIGIKRDYVAMSSKDGWYSYIMKHFYDNYIPSIKEVFLIDPLLLDGIPYSTSIKNVDDKTIKEIKTYENPHVFGADKILNEYHLENDCFTKLEQR